VSLAVERYTDFKRAMLALEKVLLERNLITQDDLEDVALAEADEDTR